MSSMVISGPMVTPVVEHDPRHARRRCDATRLPAGRACPRPCPSPTASTRRTGRARGTSELRVQRCGACGAWQWGPEWICHRCLSFDMSWERVAGRGRIYSWERAWHPVHPALQGPRARTSSCWSSCPTPATSAWSATCSAIPQQEVAIGAAVEAVFEPHDEAKPPYTLVQWRCVDRSALATPRRSSRPRARAPARRARCARRRSRPGHRPHPSGRTTSGRPSRSSAICATRRPKTSAPGFVAVVDGEAGFARSTVELGRGPRYRDTDLREVLEALRPPAASVEYLDGSTPPASPRVPLGEQGPLSGLDLLVAWVAHDQLHLAQLAGTLARLWANRWPERKPSTRGLFLIP